MFRLHRHSELEDLFADFCYETYPNRLQILIYNPLQRGFLELNAYLSLDKQTLKIVTNARHFARSMGCHRFMIEGHAHDTPIERDFYLTVGNRVMVHGLVSGISPSYTFSVHLPANDKELVLRAINTLSENWSY